MTYQGWYDIKYNQLTNQDEAWKTYKDLKNEWNPHQKT